MWKKKTCPKRLERRFSNCISYVLYFVKRIGYSYHFQVYRVIEEGRRATAEETVANSNNNFPIANRVGYDSFSDVGENRVYFASKILTPCRMH